MNAVAEIPFEGGLRERQREFVGLARQFAEGAVGPRAAALDQGDGDVMLEVWGSARELGLDCALVPEDAGGVGLDADTFCLMLEELAVGEAGSSLALLLHNAAAVVVAKSASDIGPSPIEEGERWVCTMPPLDGRSPFHINSKGGDTVVSGGMPFILGAGEAAGAVVFAADSDSSQISAASVRFDGRDVKTALEKNQMGLRAAPAAELFLPDHICTEVELINMESTGMAVSVQKLILNGMAAISRGIGRYAESCARAYAEERRQGGVRIAEHDAVRSMLGSMIARREGARRSSSAELGPALAAKIAAADAALETATDAVQVFGGYGYVAEMGVERALRDAKYCQLFPYPGLTMRLQLSTMEIASSL